MLRVLTLEDECEFLKISVANFSKVKLVRYFKIRKDIREALV